VLQATCLFFTKNIFFRINGIKTYGRYKLHLGDKSMKLVQFEDLKNRRSITIDQKRFDFDYVFSPNDKNEDVNEKMAESIVKSKYIPI
jgi:hypothetical protein